MFDKHKQKYAYVMFIIYTIYSQFHSGDDDDDDDTKTKTKTIPHIHLYFVPNKKNYTISVNVYISETPNTNMYNSEYVEEHNDTISVFPFPVQPADMVVERCEGRMESKTMMLLEIGKARNINYHY